MQKKAETEKHKTRCVPRTGSRITAPIPAITRTDCREKNRGWLTAQPVLEDELTGYEENKGCK
jgi:hypothetical protein